MPTLSSLYQVQNTTSASVTTNFTIPAVSGTQTQEFDNVNWVNVGQYVHFSDGVDYGVFKVTVISGNTLTLENVDGDTSGTTIGIGGTLSPAGVKGATGASGTSPTLNPAVLPHIPTPSSPSAGNTAFYAKSDNKLYFRPAGGAETEVGSGTGGGREVLTGNRIYYVRTDGSDSNDGLSNTAGGAFLTIQKAVDVAVGLDLNIYDVTIQIGNGTYNGKINLKNYISSGGVIKLRGNASDVTLVVLDYTASSGGVDATIDANGVVTPWYIGDFTFASTATNRFSIRSWNGSSIIIDKPIRFTGTVGGVHIFLDNYGKCFISSNYTINGSTGMHIFARVASTFIVSGSFPITVTLSGSAAFTSFFINAQRLSMVDYWGFTLSGSATGIRYNAIANSVVFTNGGTLPGDTGGTTATGGQYL